MGANKVKGTEKKHMSFNSTKGYFDENYQREFNTLSKFTKFNDLNDP